MFELHSQLAADTFTIAQSDLNLLLLMNDQNYPWFILVPKVADVREVFQLPQSDQHQLTEESSALSETLVDSLNAHKINIAALGNMVPQLHIHHIARYREDPAWPKPVWGLLPSAPYKDDKKAQLIETLKSSTLDRYFSFS